MCPVIEDTAEPDQRLLARAQHFSVATPEFNGWIHLDGAYVDPFDHASLQPAALIICSTTDPLKGPAGRELQTPQNPGGTHALLGHGPSDS